MSPPVSTEQKLPEPEEVEDIEETDDEFEDEEIEQHEEDYSGEDDLGEEDFSEGENVYDGEMFDNGVDLAELLTATLATEDGDTVCSALVTIGEQLATQNKILLKMLSTLSKKDS